MNRFALLSLLLSSPALAAVGPDYVQPQTDAAPAYKSGVTLREARPLGNLDKGSWWEIYQEPRLNELMQQATATSQSLKVAVARFDQARARANFARADFMPTGSIGLTAENQRTSENMASAFPLDGLRYEGGSYRTPLEFSWEIDLWGRLKRRSEAEAAEAFAAASAMQNAWLRLHADVAMQFFQIRALDLELAAVEKAVGLRTEAWEIARARVEAGAGSELEEAQSRTELETARAELSALRKDRDERENALAVLVGLSPSRFQLSQTTRALRTPPSIPAGVPSDLLERRPDISQAERQLAAASARIGVARSAAYPSLFLSGMGAFDSGDLDVLFEPASLMWNVGPKFTLPLFSGSRDRSRNEEADAAFGEALANYRQTILTAFGEVESSLSALHHLERQSVAQGRAEESAIQAAELAQARYEAGTSPYLDVLAADRTSLEVQRVSARLAGERLMASIGLVKALGGGWNQAMPVEVPPVEPDEAEIQEPHKRKGLFSRVKSLFSRGDKEAE